MQVVKNKSYCVFRGNECYGVKDQSRRIRSEEEGMPYNFNLSGEVTVGLIKEVTFKQI